MKIKIGQANIGIIFVCKPDRKLNSKSIQNTKYKTKHRKKKSRMGVKHIFNI